MSTKFFDEFTIKSKGEFPMLKLNSATYYKDKRELVVKFIISAFEVRSFDEESKKKVLDIIRQMFSGVDVSVQYIRTYADNNVVKNKVLEFFNRNNQMIFRCINDDTLKIEVGDNDIDVKFVLDTPTYKLLTAGDLLDRLNEYLDCSFNQNIDIIVEEGLFSDKKEDDLDFHIDTTLHTDSSLRLVSARVGEKVYARGKIDGISQMPNYIIDVKGACDNIVLCGKISQIEKKSYKNKKYNPDDPKSGLETLPFVKFVLDDTTGRIEGVSFVGREEDADRIVALKDQSQVICMGKVTWSQFSGAWSFQVNAMFEAEIDFASIHLTSIKPVPEKYVTITPQKYVDMSEKTLLDAEKPAPIISDFFKDKTFVIFDLETTDLKTEIAEIIELAALKVVNGVPTETFQTLLKPLAAISEEITAITHISNAMVLDAPSIESVMPDFFKFAHGSILCGHNIAGYDYPIVSRISEKMGYNFDNELCDTLLLARKYLTELPNCKLETISKAYGISHENAHRAMSDVYATFGTLQEIAKRM